ncbi:nicotinic acid mononucleotide adenylyltransferase [Micromonospora echinospora]|uniref:Probable nicotinate-nucleotide adenylyltransferase n=1 Tax=Micromonospora echinospora TaxID=1877 RepID=A0A1C4XYC4_MICEC|nr:nicotinate-nucleotide adenylyltransferase [Micromonospora echinospora]OZV84326.1 nicotinic acid mononucleotide adenylyltransferase [Micromonospora echinospora]SCF13458.1 nicotinate-nucleotide adenylyltransferase [Micromonospora echinospora]
MEEDIRRIGIMGGTFDPIHHGHLVAASEVADRFGLDEVVFVPTGQPWQKADEAVSPPEDRYLMTVVATASNPRFQVSRVDIDRGGPTYTVDTLRDLHAEYGPKVQLYFITGADALARILSWKDLDEIFELAHFIAVTRPGFELSDAHLPADTVSLVQVPAMAISSTDCRARVARGEPVWYLVPDGVVQYIAKRGLYQGTQPPGSSREVR